MPSVADVAYRYLTVSGVHGPSSRVTLYNGITGRHTVPVLYLVPVRVLCRKITKDDRGPWAV